MTDILRYLDIFDSLLGPERCAEVTNAAEEISERFANLQERLLDIPEGGCIAMLPSNSKLQSSTRRGSSSWRSGRPSSRRHRRESTASAKGRSERLLQSAHSRRVTPRGFVSIMT